MERAWPIGESDRLGVQALEGRDVGKQSAKCARCSATFEVESTADSRVICPHCGAALARAGAPKAAARPDPLIGTRLADFEIVELIGRGGMGSVYRARQVSLDRFVALKVLAGALSRDASFVARFEREARAAAAVQHPNIIRIIAIGSDQGRHYMAMELVEGETLSAILRREGPLGANRVVVLMRQAAAALAEAHGRGIVHRDIKPSNVLVQADGLVKVADFGLAKRTEGDVEVTQAGTLLGTPLYMAPEIAAGRPAEPRSDLYSLGATFYHVLAGRPPFQGAHPAELAIKQANEAVPLLASLAPETPRELCRIIHRLLRKNADDRFPSAAELLKHLGAGPGPLPADTIRAPAVAPRPPAARGRPRGRHTAPIGLVGGAAAVAAVALAMWAFNGPSTRKQASVPRPPVPAPPQSPPPLQPPHPPPKAEPWAKAEKRLAPKAVPPAFPVAPEAPIDPAPPRTPARPAVPEDPPVEPPAKAGPIHPPAKTPSEAAKEPWKLFRGSVSRLAGGRVKLRYDFSRPAHLDDWQITAGPPSRIDGGEAQFGGPNGNSLMHVASFVGGIEVTGSWRIVKSFQEFCDLSVNFCNAGGRYYAVSLAPIEQRIFKDDGMKPALARRPASCPNGMLHTFRIARQGVRIQVSVDGQAPVEAIDRDYTRGAVGLGAWFAIPAVKEITITGCLDPDWLALNPDALAQIRSLRVSTKGE